MNENRNDTIRDVLRTLRMQGWLVAVVTAIFVAGAIVYTSRQDKVYEAEASLQFTDPNEDFRFLGTPAGSTQTPEQRATIAARQIRSPEVAQRAVERLRESGGVPSGSISAQPEARSNLVIVRGEAEDPRGAARLSNAYAAAALDQQVADVKARIRTASRSLERSIRRLRRDRDLDRFNAAIYRERVARLETIRNLTAPVELISSASVPSLPTSPKPVRTAILGGILGLTLGLLAAFLRSALDRRLRGARDVAEHLALPLVGYVREETLGRTIKPGDKRVLDEQDLEGFRITRRNLDFLDVDRRPTCVVVTSPLPQEGKSTVALGIAHVAVNAGQRVLLVECDLRRPTLAERCGVEPGPGLVDYLAGHAEPTEILRTLELPAPATATGNGSGPATPATLVLVPAGQPTPRSAEMLASQRFKAFMEQVREVYDVVVVDTSPLLPVADTLELAPAADAIVLCVRSGQTTRDQAKAARDSLAHLPDRPTAIVVTGLRPRDDLDYGYYSYAYAYPAKT